MTITIRNHITGEAIKSWNQPGGKADAMRVANNYLVGDHAKMRVSKGNVEVWVLP